MQALIQFPGLAARTDLWTTLWIKGVEGCMDKTNFCMIDPQGKKPGIVLSLIICVVSLYLGVHYTSALVLIPLARCNYYLHIDYAEAKVHRG